MKPAKPPRTTKTRVAASAPTLAHDFAAVLGMIQAAREQTFAAVNAGLVDLYWRLGAYISQKLESAAWGEGVVEALARHIARSYPGVRGFTRANLFRMRQFHDAYRDNEKVATLLRQLPWSAHLHILAKTKRPEEREFYLRLSAEQHWPVREVARQIDSAQFERSVLHPPKLSTVPRESHSCACMIVSETRANLSSANWILR